MLIGSRNERTFEFFAGNGEMAALMRAFDWSQTPLGDPSEWPQSLRTTIRILLTSKFSMWMAWGSELTFFYNDAYRETLGNKHPWALGNPSNKVWAEIWPDIGPLIEDVMRTGEATWQADLLLFLERSGFREETYHTFSYQPISDDSGNVNGMLCVVTEETQRVIGDRRMALLRDVASQISNTKSEQEVLNALERCLRIKPQDAPFALTYLVENAGRQARLACATNVPGGTPIDLERFDIADGEEPWPFEELLARRSAVAVKDLQQRFSGIPKGPWEDAPNEAVMAPIAQQGQDQLAGFLIAGVNPYRPLDAEYLGFFELLAGQVAAGLANAQAYDIERRRAEELAKIDKAKTAFFSNVSHELRTPLTLILGPLEEALASDLPGDLNENLATAHRNSLRLLKLVNTLLNFSRIEDGRINAQFEPMDLSQVTAELASNFRSAAERAGIELTVDTPPLGRPVYVDPDMWEKIVLNLVSNAYKHTFHGLIEVKMGSRDGCAVLSVRDTGTGIPAEELPKIFDRFHRVEGVSRRTHEGTGIGLALVHELVNLLRGSISVQSQLGSGSTFEVSVPFGSGHLPADRVVESPVQTNILLSGPRAFVEEALRWAPDEDPGVIEPSLENRARIVLAEDNADMRAYLGRLLAGKYPVEAVADGEEALRAIRRERPALLLTDVMMPRMDGFQLLRTLREDADLRDLPVLVLSARAGEEARVEGLTHGADDYLAKPFSARELLACLQSILKLDEVRKEARDRERQLRQEAEATSTRLDFVMRRMHDLFSVFDTEWRYVYMSDSVTALAGLRREELLGRSLWEFFGETIGTPLEQNLRTAMSARQPCRFDFYNERYERWFDVRADPTPDGGMAVFAIDTTDRIHAEQELEKRVQERTAELQDANREMEGFTYTVSHDLRTPLRSIVFNSSVLLEDLENELSDEHKDLLRRQANSALKLSLLINDLLRLSRLSRQPLRRQHVDLTALARTLIQELKSSEHPQCKFVVSDSLSALGDPELLQLALRNLLENACKFSPGHGTIEVGRQNDAFFVRDQGIGFEQVYAGKVFEPFERLVTEKEFPGTGIGLANVKRIVERHGGKVWAESKPGKGSTFYFTLGD